MFRVVLDTNVVVSACLVSQGASSKIVEMALAGAFTLCVSEDVLSEYREVLTRQRFSQRRELTRTLLDGIEEIADTVAPTQRVDLSRDEEDNRFLECAQAAEADYLVTGNQRHFPAGMGSVRIVSPRGFLTELGF